MLVTLTPRELKFAMMAAEEREAARNRDGHRHIAGWTHADTDGPTMHYYGAIGELVVAKVLGLYWSGPTEELGAPDVGVAEDNIEVRTTMSIGGPLIIRPEDPSNKKYHLVAPTSDPSTFNLVGWMLSGDAKKHSEWLEAPCGRPPAYFVQQWLLLPVESRWTPEGPTAFTFPKPVMTPPPLPVGFLSQFSVSR